MVILSVDNVIERNFLGFNSRGHFNVMRVNLQSLNDGQGGKPDVG
jgi:hypothetical protein